MEAPTLQPGQSIRPNLTLNQAKSLIKEYFGHEVSKIKELNSYDDKNYYVETTEPNSNGKNERFIFKVLNSMDSQKTGHIEAQHGVMFHLAGKNVNCPIPQNNLKGKTFSVVSILSEDKQNGPKYLIRLLSFVEGKILYDVPVSVNLLYKTGAYVALIESYLKECKYSVLDDHKSHWLLGSVLELEKFIYVIQDQPERYQMVEEILNNFKTQVLPVIPNLEKGVVHGDFNEQNILVQPSTCEGDYEISGVIDFGDLQISPYAFELAIVICYMMLECIRSGIVDPFESVGHVIAGYSKYRKVPESEMQIMRTLVACRLCQSLVYGAYTYAQDPGNEYVLITAGRGWNLLNQLWNSKTDQEIIALCSKFL